MLAKPHGGRLIQRLCTGDERRRLATEMARLPRLDLTAEQASDVWNLGSGAYSPLEGFLGPEDFRAVLFDRRLASGVPWTIPIVLDVSAAQARTLGDAVGLWYRDRPLARLDHVHPYPYDRQAYAKQVFGTAEAKHPGVAKVLGLGDFLVGGTVTVLGDPETDAQLTRYRLTPPETRVLFNAKGWRTVVGFQTRNVPHLGHEYVQKTALTFVDGLFINPVIGRKKAGDFKDAAILAAYEALVQHYYPRERAVLATLHTEMRYAGPREAIFHAIVRKNFGCTHFIVGRDHAGVGNYYAPYAAQEIFDDFPDLGITPLFFTAFFYCRRCGSVANDKTCPHGAEARLDFSGTLLRRLLTERHAPDGLIRPEVAEIILGIDNPFVEVNQA
ncbi:MAG TPA: sulfate adenylyltransferase [Alphaproteobacteria bacterium]|nr:sulfate adenylyltransferase [Alphaproteobacteria bacterium]